MTDKRTISLPGEQSAYVDGLVASGLYASASEVVRAGLRALQERDHAVEQWLKAEVAPVYDRMLAEPDSGRSVDDVFAAVRRNHARRLREGA